LRLVLNAAYAYHAKRADEADRAELLLKPHVDEQAGKDLCRNREALDEWLAAPYGEAAEHEQAVIRYLTT
jgi:hypothetical protein